MEKTPCIINADGISFSYGEKQILSKVGFIVNDPLARIAIIGKNGSGKSTFLKIIAGKIIPDHGEVEILSKINVCYFDQHSADHLVTSTPFDCLRDVNVKLSDQEIHKYLGDLGLTSQFHKAEYASLSGGQKSRVSLAKLMVSDPDFLLLDEVTNHLDINTCSALTQAINNFKGPVIMISHNLDFITSTNCKVYELSDSKLVETTIEKYQDKIWTSLD